MDTIPIPLDVLLAAVEEQRNTALTELAKVHVLIGQLVSERDQLAAELAAKADAAE